MSTPHYTAKVLSPILPVEDMERCITFYREVLGFEVGMQSDSYSIVKRGAASLHLTLAEDASVMQEARGHLSIYLEVEGIDELWAHAAQFKEQYKMRDIFDRDYGMREFHVVDPEGCLVFVGQEIG
jgi:predicted enzyme related to lactoylglutathione lyase